MAALKDKVALITGAGGRQGVGRAIALKFASLGANLVLTDVRLKPEDMHPDQVHIGWRSIDSVAEEVRAFGVVCLPVFCDLKDIRQIESLVKQTIERFRRIDILVNNARAIIGKDRVPVTELSEEVWNHFLAINITAPFLLTKLAGREMIRQGQGGRIINIGSNNSKQARPLSTAYASSKFALIGLTQAAAQDLGRYGITVNAVCPGTVNTDRTNYWERAQAESKGVSLEELRADILRKAASETPLGRIAEPEDVANLVAFVASDEASSITGQAYNVNCGLIFH